MKINTELLERTSFRVLQVLSWTRSETPWYLSLLKGLLWNRVFSTSYSLSNGHALRKGLLVGQLVDLTGSSRSESFFAGVLTAVFFKVLGEPAVGRITRELNSLLDRVH